MRCYKSDNIKRWPARNRKRVAAMSLEGIVAKRVDRTHRSGRDRDQGESQAQDELPIIGYGQAGGSSIAALRLGRTENGKLVYAGKVGTGFTAKSGQDVRTRLLPLHRATAPLGKPLTKKGNFWVEPKLSASIEHTELTDDGLVRHAQLQGAGGMMEMIFYGIIFQGLGKLIKSLFGVPLSRSGHVEALIGALALVAFVLTAFALGYVFLRST